MTIIQTPRLITHETIRILEHKSILYRKNILEMIHSAKAGHTGGSLSCVDILNVLYNHIMNISPENYSQINRDHYIHSKGHSVEALYAVLADKGFFPLKRWQQFRSMARILSVTQLVVYPVSSRIQVRWDTGSPSQLGWLWRLKKTVAEIGFSPSWGMES